MTATVASLRRLAACGLVAALALLFLGRPAAAQGEARERLNLRVLNEQGGGVFAVDRGAGDGLAKGDRIVFLLRDGTRVPGRVTHLDDRSAIVTLEDPSASLPTGTKGFARVPRSRFEIERPEPPVPDIPEHPPWANQDAEFTAEMPLLARVRGVRPERRPQRISGRYMVFGDQRATSESGRADGFYRAGADVLVENPFGKGGELNFDGEVNYRFTQLPEQADEYDGRVRLDRLSYVLGGTRFAERRFEGGRFLQHGMPEFGVLDGFEYSRRLPGGDRWGASVGLMPEPFPDYDTGDDIQVSAWYEWVADQTEELSAAAGYQKSWHNGEPDRDLFVGRIRYLPDDGWDFNGSAWIDLYGDSDDFKGPGLGLTQAILSTGRRWDDGDSLNFVYTHLEFAEIDRYEYTPVGPDRLEDAHRDRLAASGVKQMGTDRRLHGGLGLWLDEEDDGADAQVGLGLDDFLMDESNADVTGFVTFGKFTTVLGARASYGRAFRNGRWDVMYEASNQDQVGFDENNDDIPQHRVRVSTDWFGAGGWSLNVYGDVTIWDEEGALTVGFYFTRSF